MRDTRCSTLSPFLRSGSPTTASPIAPSSLGWSATFSTRETPDEYFSPNQRQRLMKTKRQILPGLLSLLIIGTGATVVPQSLSAQPAAQSSEDSDEVETLTRGPVHEAFAETIVFDPEPGIIVQKQPPEMIEEVQPDQRPVGTNVTWIPGYWAWDDDDNDFFWISGVWRNLPPDREWIPGYWSPVDTGHQWTSGYWQDAEAEEVTYLPEPPKTLEKGPNVAASSDDQTWIPGSWEYREDNYAWRAGYWEGARENWAWTPSYYRWTPRGYVYVDGYWDYPVERRGVVFAPVRFRRAEYYQRPDYVYSPATVISLAVFSNHLFVRPRYNHYYFGDYYDNGYRERYYASYDYGHRHRGYDPIYSHYRWENRRDRDWDRHRREYFEYRRDNISSRPPRNWRDYNRLPERERERGDFRVADRYDRIIGDRDSGRRFQKVSDDERRRYVSQRKEMRSFSKEREKRELTGDRAKKDSDGRGKATREKVMRSPVLAKRDTRDEKAGGPPPRPQRKASEKKKDDAAAKGRTEGDRTKDAKEKATGKEKEKTRVEDRTKPGQRRDDGTSADKKQKDPNAKKDTAAKKDDRDAKPKESKDKASDKPSDKSPDKPKTDKPSADKPSAD
ncbi:MAG: hypothetical protein EOP84_06300, partial [Verrucomicrobiaceae bacterium]